MEKLTTKDHKFSKNKIIVPNTYIVELNKNKYIVDVDLSILVQLSLVAQQYH